MLNIISLQALRKKSTWPSKVAKNLMKWLDLIWEPYIINWDSNIYKNILILDDDITFKNIGELPKDADIIVWPNVNNNAEILSLNLRNIYRFIYPSTWRKKIGDKYKHHKNWIIRPVWIDTYKYLPSKEKKDNVLIYFKTRYPEELQYCEELLNKYKIKYNIINYDTWYKEKSFLNFLDKSKYVIRIGRQETQWIALEEALSKNVPILLWDVKIVWDWMPVSDFEKKYHAEGPEQKEKATSAEYFDQTCWIRFYNKEDLEENIDIMEKNRATFTPRNYILKNLSLEKQAKEMVSFYKNINQGNDVKKKKYMRNNLLLKVWWIFLDSKIFSIFYKPLIKLYQNITIKK